MEPFRVNIIESLSPDDMFAGRAEGRMLCESFALAGVSVEYHQVANAAMFAKALALLRDTRDEQLAPVLHLSCHGNEHGLQLTSNEVISWYDLRHMLLPVNKAHHGRLIVCMSACKGLFASGMALHPSDPPFATLVGPAENVAFHDAAVAFTVFYHQLSKGFALADALQAMTVAIGERNFDVIGGGDLRDALLSAIAAQGLPTAGL